MGFLDSPEPTGTLKGRVFGIGSRSAGSGGALERRAVAVMGGVSESAHLHLRGDEVVMVVVVVTLSLGDYTFMGTTPRRGQTCERRVAEVGGAVVRAPTARVELLN